ncbi:MAG: response regulator transcription factor [Acidobacteriota bacterium]|nr:response regulator transcription factor [Acidobacteriota bacterium]
MTGIRIVIAEDEFFTREGIVGLLNREPDFQVIGEASSGEEAVTLAKQLKPDVLLLDIRMPPGIDGIEVIRRLRGDGYTLPIVALTNEKRLIRAVEQEGGNGFIPKNKHGMFIPSLRCVAQTGSNIFISPDISQRFRQLQERVKRAELTDLETSVWKLIAYKNEEIARRMHKAEGRIRNLVTELYFKLDIPKEGKLSQRVQAIELARLYGILEEPEEMTE